MKKIEETKVYQKHLKAVKLVGWNLQFVPEKFRTYELCYLAVKDLDKKEKWYSCS
mgnify:CR=1 FL=1